MEFDQIKELIKLLQETNISEFKYESTEMSLSIRTKDYNKFKEVVMQPTMMQGMTPMQMQTSAQPTTTPETANNAALSKETLKAAEQVPVSNNYIEIKSPMVGTFYRSATPEKPPFVKVGDSIGPDSTVCLIEAMKLFNDVKAEISGKIVKVMVEDATPVEYEQVLFLVEPA